MPMHTLRSAASLEPRLLRLRNRRHFPAWRCSAWLAIMAPVLCVPVGIASPIPHFHRQPKAIVQTIQRMEQRLQYAELTGNTAMLHSLLADDYLGINSNGTLATREEALAGIRSGAVRFTAIHTSDQKIRVYGPTVVAISHARVRGIHNGADFAGEYRYTRVYHCIDGKWQVIHSEASSIRKHRHFH